MTNFSVINPVVTGEQNNSINNAGNFRGDKTAALVTTLAHGAYSEACWNGRLFGGNALGLTTAAGNIVAHAAAASTNTCLWNPVGSGKTMNLLEFVVSIRSGTPTLGELTLGVMANHTIANSLATATVPTNLKVGSANTSVGAFQTSAAGATLTGGNTSTSVMIIAGVTATAPATAGLQALTMRADLKGGFQIGPGMAILPLWTGANPVYSVSYLWEELPYT